MAIFDQRLILRPGFGCRTGDDRDSRTAGYHVPHGFQRTALQRAAHAAGFGKFRARLYDLIAKTVTLSEQKQVFGGNGFRREALLFGQRVAGRQHDTKWLVVKRAGNDARLAEGIGDDDDVEFAAAQFFGQPNRKVLVQIKRHVWRTGMQRRNQTRQQIGRDCENDTKAQRSGQGVFALPGNFVETRRFFQHAFCLPGNLFAQRSGADLGRRTLKERNTEALLDFFQGNGQGWLADMALFGGTAKMPLSGKRDDVAKFGQCHRSLPESREKCSKVELTRKNRCSGIHVLDRKQQWHPKY